MSSASRTRPFAAPWGPRVIQAAGVVVGAWVLAACGGGGGGGDEPAPQNPGQSAALSASGAGELTAHLQALLRKRASAGAAGASVGFAGDSVVAASGVAALPSTAANTSTTLVQEAGVDEPDLLEMSGSTLFHLDSAAGNLVLRTTRRTDDGRLTPLAGTALGSAGGGTLQPHGLLLGDDGQSLAVVAQRWSAAGDSVLCPEACAWATLLPIGPVWWRSSFSVQRVDVSDPAAPRAGTQLTIDGRVVGTRRVGPWLVVVSSFVPRLSAELLPATSTAAAREVAIAGTRAADALPRVAVDGGSPQLLVNETDCYVQAQNGSTAIEVTTITVLDLRTPELARSSQCFFGGTETMTMSTTALVLASTRWSYPAQGVLLYPASIETDLHKFAFDGGRISYRGSGSVAGHLGWDLERRPYRLSEHEGVLRVLSFTGSDGWMSVADAPRTAPSPATLTLLREDTASRSLRTVATLPNTQRPAPLGKPGEQVHGVRFVGTRGYLVTFRRTDPLYVLDLADTADPRVLGSLEAPGFSDHLVPLSPQLLLGVGQEADADGRTAGVKVALLDVTDPTQPRLRATQVFGAAGSATALDFSRQGLSLLIEGQQARAALPLMLFDAGYSNRRTGLQRLQVDLAAMTLATPPLLGSSTLDADADLAHQRSVITGGQVIHLRGGALQAYDW